MGNGNKRDRWHVRAAHPFQFRDDPPPIQKVTRKKIKKKKKQMLEISERLGQVRNRGADMSQISNLPTRTIHKEEVDSESKDDANHSEKEQQGRYRKCNNFFN